MLHFRISLKRHERLDEDGAPAQKPKLFPATAETTSLSRSRNQNGNVSGLPHIW
jgi:hypothetical protein